MTAGESEFVTKTQVPDNQENLALLLEKNERFKNSSSSDESGFRLGREKGDFGQLGNRASRVSHNYPSKVKMR